MGIQTASYGGNGGTPFNVEAVHSVGVHFSGNIDALVLNGVQHGGDGGQHDPEIFLADDEYISGFSLRSVGSALHHLLFYTSQGKEIGVAHVGANSTIIGDIRVLGLGGRSGGSLDNIAIKYIDNYIPSALIEESVAVINVLAPGATIDRFTSTQVQTVVSHTTTMEKVFSLDLGAESKALGEFIAKLTAAAGYKSTTREELKNEVTVTTQNTEKSTFTTPAGTVGLELVPVHVFVDTQASPNFVWIWPNGASTIVTVPNNANTLNASAYDLTKVLGVEIPSLLPRRQQRNGYNFYRWVSTDPSGDECDLISICIGRWSA